VRVRVRYAKLGKVRFISAIDMGRIWERSLRRADLPIAYSEGFSPHPKVSFPDALTLGYASTGEYAELAFVGAFDIDRAMAALNAALPDGMDVLSAVEVADGAPRLSKWLLASVWDLDYGRVPGMGTGTLQPVIDDVLTAEEVIVGRDRKGEITAVDLRPAIVDLNATRGMVRAVLHHTEPPMRPQEIHRSLSDRIHRAKSVQSPFPEPALVTRVAQGWVSDDGVTEAISGDLVPAVPPARQKATT
jgi:radical SAM-linked protein